MKQIAMVALHLLYRRSTTHVLAMVFAATTGLVVSFDVHAQQATATLFLVARPQIRDPLFAESVVLVTRHGRSRPMGVILNKPTNIKFGIEDNAGDGAKTVHTLFLGGPVSPQMTVYLYKDPGAGESAGRKDLLDLGNGLFMGMGQTVPSRLLAGHPGISLKAFRGFSSWAHGQLEREISRGDWLVMPFEAEQALRTDVSRLWEELIARASQRQI